MARCALCDEEPDDESILDHLRIVHPDAYGEGPIRWPDGKIVVFDETVDTPEDM